LSFFAAWIMKWEICETATEGTMAAKTLRRASSQWRLLSNQVSYSSWLSESPIIAMVSVWIQRNFALKPVWPQKSSHTATKDSFQQSDYNSPKAQEMKVLLPRNSFKETVVSRIFRKGKSQLCSRILRWKLGRVSLTNVPLQYVRMHRFRSSESSFEMKWALSIIMMHRVHTSGAGNRLKSRLFA
jgi:hypothetical protein